MTQKTHKEMENIVGMICYDLCHWAFNCNDKDELEKHGNDCRPLINLIEGLEGASQ